MKEIKAICYQSEDGKIFNEKEDCELYEDFLNKRIETFSYDGKNFHCRFFDQERLKIDLNNEIAYVKATGVDTISRFIDFMQKTDGFTLIQGNRAEDYKDYIVIQWIEENTWIVIPDIQIEFYKKL